MAREFPSAATVLESSSLEALALSTDGIDPGDLNSSALNGTGFVPPSPPPVQVWLPTVLVYGLTFIVGLLGNALVIFSIKRCKRLQTATNFFLASLATADLIVVVIVIPFQTPTYFSWRWELGGAMCKLLPYLTLLSSSCSVFMMTAMSIERYFVIIHPLLAKSMMTQARARKIILVVWVIAVVYSIPPLYYKKHVPWDLPNYPTFHTCTNHWPNAALGRAYSLYLLLGVYLIPLVIMMYCYSRIIFELWVSTKMSRKMQCRSAAEGAQGGRGYSSAPGPRACSNIRNGDKAELPEHATESYELLDKNRRQKKKKRKNSAADAEKNRRQVIIMLVLVVALFMFSWGPLIWLAFLVEFNLVSRYSPTKTYLGIAFNLLSYLNSCMNPICYAFISRTFRECFYWACRTCCRQISAEERYASMTNTTMYSKSAVTYVNNRKPSESIIADVPGSRPVVSNRETTNFGGSSPVPVDVGGEDV